MAESVTDSKNHSTQGDHDRLADRPHADTLRRNDSPNITNLLAGFGYDVLAELKPGKVFLCDGQEPDRRYVLRRASGPGTTRKFLNIREQYENNTAKFKLLYLPLYFGTIDDFDIFEYVEGHLYSWSENENSEDFGGRSIDADLFRDIITLSQELDTLGVFTDFYWRNFVFMKDGRIAVIDWEHVLFCKDSSERLAYLYCLMFGNERWQRNLIKEARKRKLIQYQSFRDDIRHRAGLFCTQWSQKSEVRKIREIQERIVFDVCVEYRYNAIWNSIDLKNILRCSDYHVFEDLGQERAQPPQIDCAGKLACLGMGRYDLANKKLLDIGCNAGWFLKEYAKLGARPLVGIDTEKVWCEMAKTLLKFVYGIDDVKIHNRGFFGYSGELFDIVMATSMLHYVEDMLHCVEDKRKFFCHARTLLRKGGLLIVETPITEDGEDVVILDMNPRRYIPSRRYLDSIASEEGFKLVYFGPSNRRERRVFHFSKVEA